MVGVTRVWGMRTLLAASLFVFGCTPLDGRETRARDAATDAQPDAADAQPDAADAQPDAQPYDVSALRVVWPMSVTAISARFEERGRVILSSGAAEGADRDFALTRFTLAGALDPFPGADAAGHTRIVAERNGVRLTSVPRAMTVDRQGRVITVGGGLAGGRRYGVVARWLPDGSVDTSFGVGGASRVGALVVRRRAPRDACLSLAARAGALPPHFAPLVTPDTALDAVTDDSRLQMPPNCV